MRSLDVSFIFRGCPTGSFQISKSFDSNYSLVFLSENVFICRIFYLKDVNDINNSHCLGEYVHNPE
jgi:hypothetical protein